MNFMKGHYLMNSAVKPDSYLIEDSTLLKAISYTGSELYLCEIW